MFSWFSLFLVVVLKIFQPGASQTLSTPIVSTTCTSVTITSEIDPFISSYVFSWNLINGDNRKIIAIVGLNGRGNVLQIIRDSDVMNRITVISSPNVLNPNNAPFNSTLVFQFDNDTTVYQFGVFASPLSAIAPPVTKPTCNPTSSIFCPNPCLCDSAAVEVCDDGFTNRSGICEADGTFSFIETCPTATTDSNTTPKLTIDSSTSPTIDSTTSPTFDSTTKPTIDSTTTSSTDSTTTSTTDSTTHLTIDSTTTLTPTVDSTTTLTPSTTTPTIDSTTTLKPTIDSNTTPTVDSTTALTPSTTTPTIDLTTTPTVDSTTTLKPTIDSNTTPTIDSTTTPTTYSNTIPTNGLTTPTLQTSTESGSLFLVCSFQTLFCALLVAVVNVFA